MGGTAQAKLADARRASVTAGVVALLAGALTCVLVKRTAVICRGGLETIAEPSGWANFPVLTNHAPFEMTARYVGKVLYGRYVDGKVVDPATCRYAGVSVQDWLNQYTSSRPHNLSQLEIRQEPGANVYVVSAESDYPQLGTPPTFLAAFRRSSETRIAWTRGEWEFLAILFGLSTLASAAGASVGGRRSSRAACLLDEDVYRPGTVDASGALTVDGQIVRHAFRAEPGTVLARLSSAGEPHYRAPAGAEAVEVCRGSLPQTFATSARAAARRGLVIALVLAGFGVLGAACSIVPDEVANIY